MENNIDLLETTIEAEQTEEQSSDFFDLKIVADGKLDTKSELLKRDTSEINVSCIILLTDSPKLKCENKSYNLDVLGNPMYTYVTRACPVMPKCVEYMGENIVEAIKPHLTNSEYTLVLYSDTPLITKKNILNILDFVKTKGLNVCKLTRGFVFKTDYIKRVDEIYAPSTYYFEEEDFMMALTYKQLHIISEILKNRIISYHMQNGVYFKAPENVYIEAGVSIGKGSVIDPFVYLGGKTSLGENVFVGAFSTVKNSQIFDNVKISGAFVENSAVMKNVTLKSYARLLSKVAIKQNSVVEENAILSNAVIGEDCFVGRKCQLNYLTSASNVQFMESCKVIGDKACQVEIEKGAIIGKGARVLSGVKLSENQIVADGLQIGARGVNND